MSSIRDDRREDWGGDGVMDATLIVIDSDAELARALKRLDALMGSDDPATAVRNGTIKR
jgi:hypothetical protein